MRIVLVDDHELTRQRIRKLLGKIKSDYEVIGEAADGLEGIKLIQETRPDLVIADIKMPNMTGIEMFSNLKEQGITCKAVLLSGFAEFESAQKAISLGISNYLLKPITSEDLTSVLEQIEKALKKEKSNFQNRLVQLVLSYNQSSDEAHSDKENSEMDWLALDFPEINPNQDLYTIFLLHRTHLSKRGEIPESISQMIRKEIPGAIQVNNPSQNEIIVLAEQEAEPALGNVLAKSVDPDEFVSQIGRSSVASLGAALKNLRAAIKNNLLGGSLANCRVKPGSRFSKSSERKIISDLEMKKFDDVMKALDQEIDLAVEASSNPSEVTNYFASLLNHSITVLNDQKSDLLSQINLKDQLNLIHNAVSKTEILDGFAHVIDLVKPIGSAQEPVHSLIIIKAIKIIRDQYAEDLSLESIAGELKITPEYLSSLFSKEMGAYFSIYLRDFRINKSKDLLLNTSLKTYEIAERVGYKDVKYFCNVFKKATGYSTREYVKYHK